MLRPCPSCNHPMNKHINSTWTGDATAKVTVGDCREDGCDCTYWSDEVITFRPGDKVEIQCRGKTYRGTIHACVNYGNDQYPDWNIDLTGDPGVFWVQSHGGTIKFI